MIVTVNGKSREIDDSGSLLKLIESLGLNPAGVIVELNREIISRDQVSDILLKEDDTLELIRVVGGG